MLFRGDVKVIVDVRQFMDGVEVLLMLGTKFWSKLGWFTILVAMKYNLKDRERKSNEFLAHVTNFLDGKLGN